MQSSLAAARRGRLLALVLPALLAACEDEVSTPVADETVLGLEADMVGEDVDIYLTTNGVRAGRIEADTAYFFDDSTVVHMRGVDMVVYTESGEVRANVTSDRGRMEQTSSQMWAQGNVVLVMPTEGRRIESAELWYDPTSDQVWSDSLTTYRHDGQVTRGSCFRSDLSFRNYEVCSIRGSADIGGG